MNTGSKFVSVLTVAFVCLSISGCGPSEQQLKEKATEKAKEAETAQIDALKSKALAGTGPTSLGSISIGMSKAEYVSALGINPINCNTYKDRKGEQQISELKYLSPETKTLCWGLASDFDKKGSIENVQVSDLSYDVIEANTDASKFVETVGHSSKAIFLKDRLISLEITFPNAGLETLTAKYGEPKLVDNRKTEVCQNRIGNEFKNEVGKLDAVWINGEVRAIRRATTSSPRETCSDGITMQYYILEEPSQLALIEDAITKYRVEISKKEDKKSPF